MAKIIDITSDFHFRIKTLYDIEKQLESALPKMAKAVTNIDLKEGLLAHLEETKAQSKRLEQIFEIMEVTPRKFKGETIKGLLADGADKMNADVPDTLRDVMIAGVGRSVEHFEMVCYENAIDEATNLGLDTVIELLTLSLGEEVAAAETLKKAFIDNLKLAGEEEEGTSE